jgi:hypothetical protein
MHALRNAWFNSCIMWVAACQQCHNSFSHVVLNEPNKQTNGARWQALRQLWKMFLKYSNLNDVEIFFKAHMSKKEISYGPQSIIVHSLIIPLFQSSTGTSLTSYSRPMSPFNNSPNRAGHERYTCKVTQLIYAILIGFINETTRRWTFGCPNLAMRSLNRVDNHELAPMM